MEGTVDVAIIGYGPVGASAANLLGILGVSAVVIEREPAVFPRARAVSTDEEVMRIWQQTGLADRLAADMLSDRPIEYVDDAGRSFLSLTVATRGNGWPPQLFLHQPALEAVLRQGVGRFAGIEVLLGHEWVALAQDADGVDLSVTDLATGAAIRRRARYVLACDGGSSPVRKALGIGFVGRTYEDPWLVVDAKVREEWPGHDRLRFCCDPQRPAVDCPTPLGHHRWEFPLLAGDDRASITDEATVARLLARHGIGERQVEVLRATVYSHHVRLAERWRSGRVFLLGDAAHVMPPYLGQGMAAGVRDAGNLCWKLAGVLHATLPERVLDTYQQERQPHVRSVTAASVAFGRLITERRRQVVAARNAAGRAVMATPLLGPWVRAGGWFPAASYRHGLFADQLRWRGVGRQFPQPSVTADGGAPVRLDDRLGPGWAVVHLGDAPAGTAAWVAAGASLLAVTPRRSHSLAESAAPVVDVDGVIERWLRRHRTRAAVLRPDRFVHGVAIGGRLPEPPFRR